MIKIPLSNPYITFSEKKLILQVLNSPHLSLGPKLAQFEKKIASFTGTQYAVAVNSGTSALHLCIKSLNIKNGDQVITSPFSFISSANCILYENATPVFVDIDPDTLNIDVDKIEQKITAKTRAVLPVHIFGLPCDMITIQAIAREYNLKIIEDACEAIGAECLIQDPEKRLTEKNSFISCNVGSIGDCGVFGFYPNKQITTGEGGVIVTNHREIAVKCRSLRNQGRNENSSWLQHEQLGYNYRISELNCALGIAQLDKIQIILAARNRIADWYNERLSTFSEIIIPSQSPYCRRSWFVYVIRLDDYFTAQDRDKILNSLQYEGIECRKYFPPIHLQPFYMKMFGAKKGDFPQTERVADHTIALPFFTAMTEDQVDLVCETLRRVLQQNNIKKQNPASAKENQILFSNKKLNVSRI